MNQKLQKFVLITTLIYNSQLFSASIDLPACPAKINVKENLTSLPTDWELLPATSNHFLVAISIYSGHPDELASLKPDFISKKKAKWSFSANESVYIVCEYNKTSIRLTSRLPANLSSCEVNFDPSTRSESGFLPKQVNCYKRH
ncbi:STY0301 family protein [Legionella cardiaca]|uniref:Uncharacterized protein n=1 Tax=Legionella cardiaca TaxID=1071983 RepID=A0ABY8AUW7_9GAMM|nr:STY0301 family protein [Legionella cardiaca]WED44479.1 hypothetical protein PXX05_06755 [Legionella cardiaca]